MFIKPEERGNALAAPLLTASLYSLKEKGFVRAYGNYMKGNIPALWMHRLMKYDERPAVSVKRFFCVKCVERPNQES
jgi:hypothetical protein